MNESKTVSGIIFFWTGIMENHTEFLLGGLSSKEKQIIASAQYFKDSFMKIHNEAKNITEQDLGSYTNNIIDLINKFINFKRLILKKLLECGIEINFPPSFINHMINEAMEFLRDLRQVTVQTEADSKSLNISLHKIWLPDASGHAAIIAAQLDPTEKILAEKAREFCMIFDGLFIKSFELGLMIERTRSGEPELKYLNEQVEEKINQFIDYLNNIKELREKCKAMAVGTLSSLAPDHMIREENYYLDRIKNL